MPFETIEPIYDLEALAARYGCMQQADSQDKESLPSCAGPRAGGGHSQRDITDCLCFYKSSPIRGTAGNDVADVLYDELLVSCRMSSL
jgi:hypothetical protein